MNDKNDGWESYTDEVGRRHWRWPASGAQYGAGRPNESGTRHTFGLPQQQQAQRVPLPLKGK
jgi:hypothetical protein